MTNIPALTTNPEIAEMLAALNAALRQGADVINAQQAEIARLTARLALAESMIPFPPPEVQA